MIDNQMGELIKSSIGQFQGFKKHNRLFFIFFVECLEARLGPMEQDLQPDTGGINSLVKRRD